MKILRSVVVLAVALAVCGAAWAQSDPPHIPGVNAPGAKDAVGSLTEAGKVTSISDQLLFVDSLQNTNPVNFGNLSNSDLKKKLTQEGIGYLIPTTVYISNLAVATNTIASYNQFTVTNFLNGAKNDGPGTTMTTAEVAQAVKIMTASPAQSAMLAAASVTSQLKNITANRADLAVNSFSSGVRSESGFASPYHAMKYGNRLWASGFHFSEDMDAKDGYDGYKYKVSGVSAGYDRAIGPLTLGAAFTYSRGDFEQKGMWDDNDMDNYAVSAYANYYHCSGFFSTLYAGYNYADNELNTFNPMTDSWLGGDNHVHSRWAGAEIGYEAKLAEGWSLTPKVGVFYERHKGSAYDFSTFQSISKMTSKAWTLPVTLELKYRAVMSDCSALTFKVKGGYTHNFTNEGAIGSYTFIGFDGMVAPIRGVKPGRSAWNIGAGLKYEYNRFDFGVDYRYDSRKKVDAHRIAATIGISF